MVIKAFYTVLFIFCGFSYTQGQTYPKYDRQPMDLSPDISGGYCVMRGHHFHAGLDFRTQRKTGWNIYSIADGYVKRIKVSHYGYGKSIQIQHPDGYVSHYGHLSKYGPVIDAYVKKLQYQLQSYEFDFFPEPGDIPVKKGQVIAYSGNSGGSTGPHLHFEIRDSTNTWLYNPLLFGIKIADTKKPELKGLRFYTAGKDPVTHAVKVNKYGNYYISGGSIFTATGFFNFAFNAVDPQDGSGFHNSVYHAQLFVDDSLVFEFKMDSIKIDDLRSSDFHMDYENWVKTGEYYEKLWFEDGNRLPIYNMNLKKLSTTLSNGLHTIKIRLADYNKNTTSFTFKISMPDSITIVFNHTKLPLLMFNEYYSVSSTGNEITVTIPANTMFMNIQGGIPPTITSSSNEFGEINFTIGNKYIPIHNAYKVDIKVNHQKIPIDKLCLVYYGKEGKMKYYSPTTFNENSLTFELKDLGSFSVWADTVRPIIKKMNIRDSMYVMYNSTVTTIATDELSDISKYNVYIDGVWHLTEYEYKEDLLSTQLPEGLSPGPHVFEIEVMDDRKNKAYRKMTILVTTNKDDLLLNKKKK